MPELTVEVPHEPLHSGAPAKALSSESLRLIHRLTYRRTNHSLHVRGYKEEGTITTPFA